MLVVLGLEMRPPFTIDDVAVAFTALAEGFALRIEMDPGRVPLALGRPDVPEAPGGWSLFACSIEALTASFTRPAAAPPS
jgi:hypothetical protein